MKVNFVSLVAGVFLAVSGSLLASSVSVPFTFSSGQKAKASDINANFSALTNAINDVDGRISKIESKVGSSKPITSIPITQIDMPIGSKITVNGVEYIILQREFPRFDTDEVYVVKFPADSKDSVQSMMVSGSYDDNGIDSLDSPNYTVTNGINGFPTFGWESFYYSSNGFGQSLSAYIYVGDNTRFPLTFRSPVNTGSDVYPTVKKKLEREQIRKNLRQLLSYVVVNKK